MCYLLCNVCNDGIKMKTRSTNANGMLKYSLYGLNMPFYLYLRTYSQSTVGRTDLVTPYTVINVFRDLN
jgi:hypothetical protein